MEKKEQPIEPKIVRTGVEIWNSDNTIGTKFEDRFRDKSGLYFVAVAYDENGNKVDIFIFEKYRLMQQARGIAHRRVLEVKARRIFRLDR